MAGQRLYPAVHHQPAFSCPTALVSNRKLTPYLVMQDFGTIQPKEKQLTYRQLTFNSTRRFPHIESAVPHRSPPFESGCPAPGATRWFPAPPLRRVSNHSRSVAPLLRRFPPRAAPPRAAPPRAAPPRVQRGEVLRAYYSKPPPFTVTL